MILGLSLATFTFLHVVISLIGIASGFVVVLGLVAGKRLPRWTALFLATTALTSLSGFLFPFKGVTPGIVLGVLSLIALLLAMIALFGRRLAGPWRGAYVIDAALALYFNLFVLIAQLFAKVPALKVIAPTPAAPAFGITQLIVMAIFATLTFLAYRNFPKVQRASQQSWDRRTSSAS